jgi:hypothetical protein
MNSALEQRAGEEVAGIKRERFTYSLASRKVSSRDHASGLGSLIRYHAT